MTAIIARMRQIWLRGFFSPESALNLAAARVIFAVHAIWVLLSRDIPAMSALPAEFWANVGRTERWRYLIVPGHAGLEYALQWTAVAALVCVVIGLMPRIACFVSALLLYHLAPLETLYWTANPFQRGLTVSVLVLFTLSFSRCGDALRLGGAPAVTPSPAYGWPLRLIQFHLANVYFLSGVSKLIRVGITWLDPQNLREWFLLFSQQDQVIREKSHVQHSRTLVCRPCNPLRHRRAVWGGRQHLLHRNTLQPVCAPPSGARRRLLSHHRTVLDEHLLEQHHPAPGLRELVLAGRMAETKTPAAEDA